MPHNLEEIPQLSNFLPRLKALGYNTLEELTGVALVSGPELSNFLGTPVSQLLNNLPVTASSISHEANEIISNATYTLGVAIDDVPRVMVVPAFGPPVTVVVADVNLIPHMPMVRDQRRRGTCVAHAALAAYEHFLHTNGAGHDLSEQFLYWDCKANDGIPQTEGTWLGVAFPLLQRDGCCLEETWPYEPNPIAGNEGQGPPAAGAQLEALTFRSPNFTQLSPTSVSDIKSVLAGGNCVAFSIPVFNSWHGNKYVALSGDITIPVPGEIRTGGHAMCMVGYFDLPGSPELGGGRFILRNSWGTTWGLDSPFGAGYGTIPYRYIERFGTEAYAIT